jgi:imidazolonepropionase-like amidohydrolase
MEHHDDLLLSNGTVLAHVAAPNTPSGYKVEVLKEHDILVRNGRIFHIVPHESEPIPSGIRLIDCTDKIISPGFIDTHHQ